MENKTLTKENIEETEKNKNDNSSKVIENNLNNQNIKKEKAKKKILKI